MPEDAFKSGVLRKQMRLSAFYLERCGAAINRGVIRDWPLIFFLFVHNVEVLVEIYVVLNAVANGIIGLVTAFFCLDFTVGDRASDRFERILHPLYFALGQRSVVCLGDRGHSG